ncbi:hypothetical protein K8T06_03120 [bacterium]|nr:hypothetical protein [bacterium]
MSFTRNRRLYLVLMIILCLAMPGIHADWNYFQSDIPPIGFGDLCLLDTNNIYFAGLHGLCYRLSDDIWEAIPTYLSHGDFLYAIWAVNENCIYAGGYNGSLIFWNGAMWNPVNHGSTSRISNIWGTSEDNVYVLGGGLHHWNGEVWQKTLDIGGWGIWGSGPDDVFILSGYDKISHFDGIEWTEQEHPVLSPVDLHGTAPDNVYLAGGYGMIAHYDGSNWTLQNTGTLEDFTDIWCVSENSVYAIADNLWHFDGEFWSKVENTTFDGQGPTEMVYVSDDEMHFIGDGKICKWDGSELKYIEWITQRYLRACWGSYPDRFFAAGEECFKYENGEFTQVEAPEIRTVLEFGPDSVFALSSFELNYWDGVSWELIGEFPHEEALFTDIWGQSSDDVWITGYTNYYGQIIMSHWDGETLEDIFLSESIQEGYWDVWGLDPACLWVIDDMSIYQFDSTVPSIETIYTHHDHKVNLNDIYGFSEDDIYVACDKGVMLHWDGVDWNEIQVETLLNFWKFEVLEDGTVLALTNNGFHYFYQGEWLPSHTIYGGLYSVIGDSLDDLMGFGGIGQINQYDGTDLALEFTSYVSSVIKGEPYYIDALLFNPGEPLDDVPVVIYLDVFGELFFWPDWEWYDSDNPPAIEIQYIVMQKPVTVVEVIPEFVFPEDLDPNHMTGVRFYGAMLTEDLSGIRGDFGVMAFSY